MVLPRRLLRLLLLLAAAVRRAGAQVGGALHPAPPRPAPLCFAAQLRPALAAHRPWLRTWSGWAQLRPPALSAVR